MIYCEKCPDRIYKFALHLEKQAAKSFYYTVATLMSV